MKSHPSVIVVMPAYNAELTLERTINDIPLDYVTEIILVDDASSDHTLERARDIAERHPRLTLKEEAGTGASGKILFTTLRHVKNRGYGGNQKNCYTTALAHGADIVIMVHPDYQYDPRLVKYFVEFIRDGYVDVMLGSRIRSRKEALAGGMPPYKYYANRILSLIQNVATGKNLSEWHTGMRAYKREVLEAIDYENFSEDFVFDNQMLLAIAENDFVIGDIPVPVRYFEEASSINFKRSTRYGLLTLWETLKYVVRAYQSFLRYVGAGGTSVAVNLGLYVVLLHAHVWYVHAAIISFCMGALVSFSLHKFWTFKSLALDHVTGEVVWYVTIISINALLNSAILYILVSDLSFHAVWANVLANAIMAVWGFLLHKHVTFRTAQLKAVSR